VSAGSLAFSVGVIAVCCLCVGWIMFFFVFGDHCFLIDWILVFSRSELLVCVGWIPMFFFQLESLFFVIVCRLDPGVFSFRRGSVFLFEWILVFSKSELLVCVGWTLAFFFSWSHCFLLLVCRLDPCVCFFPAGISVSFEWILVFSESELLVCIGWVLAFCPLESLCCVVCVSVESWCLFSNGIRVLFEWILFF